MPYKRNFEQELDNESGSVLHRHSTRTHQTGSVSVPFKHMNINWTPLRDPCKHLELVPGLYSSTQSPQLSPLAGTRCATPPPGVRSSRCTPPLRAQTGSALRGLQAAEAFSQPEHSLISPQRKKTRTDGRPPRSPGTPHRRP